MKNFIPTPVESIANGFVLTHKAEYQSKMMQKFSAPALKDVFFINAAPATTEKRVFTTPNEAVAALHSNGQKGKVYCNGEYMTVAAASKLDLQCFSSKQEGRAPGRLQLMTEAHVAKVTAPKAEATTKAATPVDNTPNNEKPLF